MILIDFLYFVLHLFGEILIILQIFISPKFELVSALASITMPKDTGHQIAAAILNLFEVLTLVTFIIYNKKME